MSFFIYDISFLIIFSIFIALFLYSRRKKITREGILYLYKTKLGIELIDRIGTRYRKQINFLKWPVIIVGYVLFVGIMTILVQAIYIYIKVPEITKLIKTPPLVPLIPYFPSIFGVESLFPPFYFTYFIIALIIVAFSHEFSHGIFAKANNVKIKSTGVVFLGPILGAFVEQDDKQMKRKGKTAQMSILGAGVFANTVLAIIFFMILLLLFQTLFIPAGVKFSTYSYGVLNATSIMKVTEQDSGLLMIQTEEQSFLLDKENFQTQIENNQEQLIAYYDAPAIRNEISGAITEINKIRITGLESFITEIDKYRPGDEVEIKTTDNPEGLRIKLDPHPLDPDRAFLGVGFSGLQESKGIKKWYGKIFFFRDPSTYYEEKFFLSEFIYNLVWWVALINIMVALFNMLPFGFLDGGRFFYLTILGITKSKKVSERAFKYATMAIILLFLLLMLTWLVSFI